MNYIYSSKLDNFLFLIALHFLFNAQGILPFFLCLQILKVSLYEPFLNLKHIVSFFEILK